MSSFSDNFDKTNKSEVQFDDAAFYPFIATLLLFSIIALIFISLKTLLTKSKYSHPKYLNCSCTHCYHKLHSSPISSQSILSNFPYKTTILLVLLSITFHYYYNKILTTKNKFRSFDPYAILDISSSYNITQIKKAYKKLALKYHPDRNPNNLQAKAKFILIAKAYDALTNEVSKKNYELYGNPDGMTSMRLSVGLPNFILEKSNHMKILLCFLFIIVIYIPMNFLSWYNHCVQYDKNDVMYKTNEYYTVLTDENSSFIHIPFYLGLAREFAIEDKYDFYNGVDGKEVGELYDIFKRFFPVGVNVIPSVLTNKNKRTICDVYAYMYHLRTMFNGSNDRIITVAKLIDQFLLIQVEKCALIKQLELNNMPKPPHIKPIRPEFIKETILFQQCFIQGIRLDCIGRDSNNNLTAYLQFPQLNMAMLQRIIAPPIFIDFLKSDADTKQKFLIEQCSLSKEATEDVIAISNIMPVYEHKITPAVEGFADFLNGDIVTYSITITRLNLSNDKEIGIGHSSSFPAFFNENLQIIVMNGGNCLQQLKVGIAHRETKTEFKLRLSNVGVMRLTFILGSTCYLGVDQEINVDIECKESSILRKEQIMKIEQQKIKIEPSYFSKMLIEAGMMLSNDADEEEEDEIEVEAKDDIKIENK